MTPESKWGPEERRLKPQYDDIATGRLKVAQVFIDKYLKKSPKSQPALVIKLVITQKTSSDNEAALKIFELVKATGQLTQYSEEWVGIALRNMQRHDILLEMYQKRWEVIPQDTDLGQQVFLTAVGAWDKDVMRESSRKMWTITEKSPEWARICAWAHWVGYGHMPSTGDRDHGEPGPEKALFVAFTMLRMAGEMDDTADLFWLRVQIYIAAKRLEEAVEIVQKYGGGGNLARDYYRMKAMETIKARDADKKVERSHWETEWTWAKAQIEDNAESRGNYVYYRYLVMVTVTLAHDLDDAGRVTMAWDWLRDLDLKIGTRERSPMLAALELDKQLPEEARTPDDDWTNCVTMYWDRFAHIDATIYELREIVPKDDSKKLNFLAGCMRTVAAEENADQRSYARVSEAMQYLIQFEEEGQDSEGALRNWKYYLEGLEYGQNLPSTDLQLGDQLAAFAAHQMCIEWHANPRDETPLLRAFICLQYALKKSPSNFALKFRLVSLARLLGVPQLIPETWFGSAGPAEIMLDTTAHTTIERGSSESIIKTMPSKWPGMLDKHLEVSRRAQSDLSMQVRNAVATEGYSKVPSMRRLADRMTRSLPVAVTTIERARCTLYTTAQLSSKDVADLRRVKEIARCGELEDLRDWSLSESKGDILKPLKDIVALGAEVDGTWVKTWSSLLIAVAEVVEHEEGPVEAELEDVPSSLPPAEKAVYHVVSTVLARLQSALAADPGDSEVKQTVAPAIEIPSFTMETSISRFAKIQDCTLLLELLKMLDLITRKVEELSKPRGSGKNRRQAPPALLTLAQELKGLKEQIKTRTKEMVAMVDELKKADEEMDWVAVSGEYFKDTSLPDFAVDIGKKAIVVARAAALKNTRALLTGKKIS